MTPAGFPHSEILGSQLGYQLPEAYRRFLRPSSAPGAKASTVCPYKLEPQRCSRPLCSSQGTGGDRPRHRCLHAGELLNSSGARGPVRRTVHGRSGRGQASERPVPQDPTACLAPTTLTVAFHSAEGGCTSRRRPSRAPNGQCSTLEHHPERRTPEQGSGHALAEVRARCSLERR